MMYTLKEIKSGRGTYTDGRGGLIFMDKDPEIGEMKYITCQRGECPMGNVLHVGCFSGTGTDTVVNVYPGID